MPGISNHWPPEGRKSSGDGTAKGKEGSDSRTRRKSTEAAEPGGGAPNLAIAALGAATVAAVVLGSRFVGCLGEKLRGGRVGQEETPPSEEENKQETAAMVAGLEGEEMFRKRCAKVGSMHFYHAVRIPDRVNRRRREIDFVVLSRRHLFVVEVKNWSGRVSMGNDGRWCQIRKDDTVQWGPDVIQEGKERARLLLDYIRSRGVEIHDKFVETRVVLVNPNCSPDDVIAEHPEVLLPDEWEDAVSSSDWSGGGRLLGWLSNAFGNLTGSVIPAETFRKVQDILDSAPTWDSLELQVREGKGSSSVLKGDLVRFEGDPEEMKTLSSIPLRPSISKIAVHVNSARLSKYLGSFFGQPTSIRLALTLRSSRRAEDQSWLKWALGSGESHSLVLSYDTEVVFRPAGASRDIRIALADVKSLLLST